MLGIAQLAVGFLDLMKLLVDSRYFNLMLNRVLQLHNVLLRAPEPVSENCTDER